MTSLIATKTCHRVYVPYAVRQQQQRCLQWNNFNTKEQPPRFVRRSKSSITTPLYPPSSSSLLHEEVYERALQNALASMPQMICTMTHGDKLRSNIRY